MLPALAKYYLSLHYWEAASIASIRSMQLKKFRKLFDHARQHSAFYREFYGDHGVADLRIESLDDVGKVPMVCKAVLRNYSIRDIMTCDVDTQIHIHSTSGSSGEPFQIASNQFEDYSAHVRLLRALMAAGYHPSKKAVLLSRYEPGHAFEIEEVIGKIGFLRKYLGLFRRELISVFTPVETIIRKLEEIKPFLLWSTPSLIEIIAMELKKQDRKLDIPLVLFMSENISPALLHLFKERIGRKFIDLYGCMEAPSIGYGVNQVDSKEIFVNSTLVEVVNHRPEAERIIGDVVISNLINLSMPLIRYDLDDRVEVLDRDTFPNKEIGRICGRNDDIIYFGEHYTLTYHQSYQLFRAFHECLQYKFVERSAGEIVLQLKVDKSADRENVKRMALQKWTEKYPNYPLAIEWKDTFLTDKRTGKFKVIEKYAQPA